MGNLLLTGLLVLVAFVAWRTMRGRRARQTSGIEEAARRATEARVNRARSAETLEPGKDGVYRPGGKETGKDGEA